MRIALTLVLSIFPILASATLIVDQQQTGIDSTLPPMEIGGPLDKRLAQTFTIGIEGVMREVHLPIECDSGILIVEINELDGDLPDALRMLDRGVMEATSLPPADPPEFRSIPLDELPPAPGDRFPIGSPSFFSRVGRRLAMVISNPTGVCRISRGIAVDPYLRGHGYFDERSMERGWSRLDGRIAPSDDLPFKTVMEADSPSPPCGVVGVGGSSAIPGFVPVCRCLEDESLLEQRCSLLHPSFFLIRRIPWPIKPGELFKVSWTLTPLTDLRGDLELEEILPKEVRASLKKPLAFRAGHMKPGSSFTLEYKALALFGKGGTFEVDTVITSKTLDEKPDVQRMHSSIEIAPPPN